MKNFFRKHTYPIPLYRIENPTRQFNEPEGDFFRHELAGQWFDLYLDGALANMNRVQCYSVAQNAPARLAIAKVIPEELGRYHASQHLLASKMSHFGDDYIIPRDGSVPIFEADIDEAVQVRDYARIHEVAASMVRSHIGRDLIEKSGRVY